MFASDNGSVMPLVSSEGGGGKKHPGVLFKSFDMERVFLCTGGESDLL